MNSYHFDIGNSDDGPVGICARVTAESEADALHRLKMAIDAMGGIHGVSSFYDDCTDDASLCPWPGIEYIRVYIKPDNITADMIDEFEPAEQR